MSNVLSAQLSTHGSKLTEPADAVEDTTAPFAKTSSNSDSCHHGLDDFIISQLDEPFDNEEQQMTVTSQGQITSHSATANETTRKLLPLQYGTHNFLNGATIHGNITINFNANTAKRRRLDNSKNIEDSEESEE